MHVVCVLQLQDMREPVAEVLAEVDPVEAPEEVLAVDLMDIIMVQGEDRAAHLEIFSGVEHFYALPELEQLYFVIEFKKRNVKVFSQ